MEKLKQYKNSIFILIVILSVTFYWYSYRPYKVNRSCIAYAKEWANNIEGDQTDVRYAFWKCQKEHGLSE